MRSIITFVDKQNLLVHKYFDHDIAHDCIFHFAIADNNWNKQMLTKHMLFFGFRKVFALT
jgi:hypothetical protein